MQEQYVVYRTYSMMFAAFCSTCLTVREYAGECGPWTSEIEKAHAFDTEFSALKWINFCSKSESLKGAIFGIEKVYKI